MRCFTAIFSVILLTIFSLSSAQKGKYKICATEKYKDECDALGRGDNEIACIMVQDWVDCASKLDAGNATYSVISAERALLLSSFPKSNNIYVIGEVRNKDLAKEHAAYEQVVIVNTQYQRDFQFRNQSFYHPGFFEDDIISDSILKTFERKVLAANNVNVCDSNSESAIENEIMTLNNFFGDSCRPGPWILDVDLDKTLKAKYPKLCKLCPGGSCDISNNVGAKSRTDAIKAVTDGRAFVAVTSAQALYEYNRTASYPIRNVKFLCPDGGVMMDYTKNVCSWVKQAWDLVIGNRGTAKDIRSFLRDNLGEYLLVPPSPFAGVPSSPRSVTLPALVKVMKLTDTHRVLLNVSDEPKNVKDFVQNYRPIPVVPTPRKPCEKDMRWCVSSANEMEKCNWLKQASMNRGIEPFISCEKRDGPLECLDSIVKDESDITVIDANYGYMAKRKTLQSLAYTEVREVDLKHVFIFTKPGSNITNIDDLRHKKVCFPEYGGLAWFSFVDWIRSQVRAETCDYGKFTSRYFTAACMPGVKDGDHGATSGTNTDNLCELCRRNEELSATADNCNDNIENRYYNNTGAAMCLEEGVADYIVVEGSVKELKKIPQLNQFRAFCKNGNLAAVNGVENIDVNCALSETIDSEIVTRRDDPRRKEYDLLLRSWDKWLVTATLNPTLNVLHPFNGEEDLIFKSTAIGFDSANSPNVHIKNFVALYEHIDKCVEVGKDGALQHTISLFILFTFIVITYFI